MPHPPEQEQTSQRVLRWRVSLMPPSVEYVVVPPRLGPGATRFIEDRPEWANTPSFVRLPQPADRVVRRSHPVASRCAHPWHCIAKEERCREWLASVAALCPHLRQASAATASDLVGRAPTNSLLDAGTA